MQIRVQDKGKRAWKSRYDGDVSTGVSGMEERGTVSLTCAASPWMGLHTRCRSQKLRELVQKPAYVDAPVHGVLVGLEHTGR